MEVWNDRIPIRVHTCRGDIDIYNIRPGDGVYDYDTGNEVKVIASRDSKIEDVYKVTYTDGRVDYYRLHECIFTGDMIVNIETLLRDNRLNKVGVIKQGSINYTKDKISTPVSPDPYMAGALLIHGDYDEENINLPLDRDRAHGYFGDKFDVDYGGPLGDNKVFFRYNTNPDNMLISWEEFFPYDLFKNDRDDLSLVPSIYKRGTFNDRWQFIRGVFDTGYSENYFPDGCAIASHSERRLQAVQRILWSMGICSKIVYDPSMTRGRIYRLDVYCNPKIYPKFFYNIHIMEKMILDEKRTKHKLPEFKLQISSVEKHTTGYSRELILEGVSRVYFTSNFLPRVSI